MSSNFSSNRAYYNSVESRNGTAWSQPGTASESPTLASKHSKTSKSSSKSSSKNLSATSSKRSAASSSKPPSKTSSMHSSKSSHRHMSTFTFAEIRNNCKSYDESLQPTAAPIGHYATSPISSNPRYTSSTTIIPEAEYRVRMQELLDSIGPGMNLSGTEMDAYDTQTNPYDAQLDLDEDDYQVYNSRAHG